jgi:hypothetical protein
MIPDRNGNAQNSRTGCFACPGSQAAGTDGSAGKGFQFFSQRLAQGELHYFTAVFKSAKIGF